MPCDLWFSVPYPPSIFTIQAFDGFLGWRSLSIKLMRCAVLWIESNSLTLKRRADGLKSIVRPRDTWGKEATTLSTAFIMLVHSVCVFRTQRSDHFICDALWIYLKQSTSAVRWNVWKSILLYQVSISNKVQIFLWQWQMAKVSKKLDIRLFPHSTASDPLSLTVKKPIVSV